MGVLADYTQTEVELPEIRVIFLVIGIELDCHTL